MKVLDGKMGEYIITARRHGENWYVAGETNWDAREVEIDASFLPKGTYELTAYFDGINAEKNASDYYSITQTFTIPYTIHEKVKVKMASGGGFAAKLIKK